VSDDPAVAGRSAGAELVAAGSNVEVDASEGSESGGGEPTSAVVELASAVAEAGSTSFATRASGRRSETAEFDEATSCVLEIVAFDVAVSTLESDAGVDTVSDFEVFFSASDALTSVSEGLESDVVVDDLLSELEEGLLSELDEDVLSEPDSDDFASEPELSEDTAAGTAAAACAGTPSTKIVSTSP
jgi:hypothetical protein